MVYIYWSARIFNEFPFLIPSRLVKAFEELNDFLKAEEDLKDIKEYGAAVTVLDEARPQLP